MGSEREDQTQEIQLDDAGEATDPEIRIPPEVGESSPPRPSVPPPLPTKRTGPPPLPGTAPSPTATTDPAPPKSPLPSAGGPRKPPARLGRSVMPSAPKPGSIPPRPSAPPPVAARTLKTTIKMKKVGGAAIPKAPKMPSAPKAPPRPMDAVAKASAAKPAAVTSKPSSSTAPKPAASTKPAAPSPSSAPGSLTSSTPTKPERPRSSRSGPPIPTVTGSARPARALSSESMTVVALQARVRSVELDAKDQRVAVEKMEALQDSLAKTIDRLTKRVDDLADAGGDKAKDRIEAMEARVAETTRMQLELAAHDDRIEALEEGGGQGSSDELLSLDGRIGAIEARLGESESAAELERRLAAAELGLADAQRALGDAHAELKRRDEVIAGLMERLEVLESGSVRGERSSESDVGGRSSESDVGGRSSESDAGGRSSESASESASAPESDLAGDPVSLTDVKGIGPKLSKKLEAAGLDDARRLAAMDDAALDTLADASGVKRGRLERLRDAAQDL